jgi:alpha-mannosidase
MEKNSSNLEFEETAKLLRELEEKFFEKDAFSLGVQTIWAENKADIWKKLQQIKMNP